MRGTALLKGAVLVAACAQVSSFVIAQPLQQGLPPTAEQAYTALVSRFDRAEAMDAVEVMQRYWRVAGNPGYNASIDHIRQKLMGAGFSASAEAAASVRVEEYPNGGPGWDYARGTISIEGDPIPVLSKERDRVSLAINSFSTAPGGLIAPLVDVGAGRPADFAGRSVKGAIVLGDAGLGLLWREAVRNGGAAGVISTEIASYIRPGDPALMDEAQRDVLQWGSVPYDEKLKGFGFKASWRAAARLRLALKQNPDLRIRADVESSFYTGPVKSLAAEIRGGVKPDERIVIVAHVQEPGANDNASGCATLLGVARAMNEAIVRGALPAPDRTVTFLWVDEIRGSRQWITAHPAEAKNVQYMFSMDMTGEDVSRTGGSFLIEKQADPSAVWPRPSDPHSEWGAGQVKVETLKGSLLNDLHIAVANRRARDVGWVVRTNPYEGGSDHTVFAGTGVPSLLNWHFTDRFYHTNQDTVDKVSAREMENVGITVATSAYFLAAADERDASALADLVARAAAARLGLERRHGVEIVSRAADQVAARAIEAKVTAAWLEWYRQALDTVGTLPAAGATASLLAKIDEAKRGLR